LRSIKESGMAETQMRSMTPEEFYRWQLDQDERYELVEGVPVPLRAMTGASNVHDAILVNCIGELGSYLRGRPCRVASANTALRTAPRTARRPDVSVDCAPPRADSYEAHRPTVVIEVLSPSTRKIDVFTKLEEYRRHPSLRHIMLIDPDAVAAKLYSRPDEGAWSDVDLIGRDAVVDLSAIEVALALAALYERIDLPA
jgi:Uma2 family endonuclease